MRVTFLKVFPENALELVVIFTCISGAAVGSKSEAIKTNSYFKNDHPSYLKDTGILKGFMENVSFQALQSLSETCQRDVNRFDEQVRKLVDHVSPIDTWALQMLDAWGKIPEGILSGHINALGDFDECLAVRSPPPLVSFQGKYCVTYVFPNISQGKGSMDIQKESHSEEYSLENLLKILAVVSSTELPIIPSIATCLPSTCSDQEILQISQVLFSKLDLISVQVYCSVDEPAHFSAVAIAIICVLAVITAFVISGTAVDLIARTYEGSDSFRKTIWFKISLAFSLASNGKKLLNTETSPNDITCLHGIRTLSSAWVVLGHTYLMGVMQPLWNVVDTYTLITSSVSLIVVLNAGIVVDVFFVMGGFLVSLTILQMFNKLHGRVNLPLLYLHRYLRITPTYLVILLFGAFVFPIMGNGPAWHIVKTWASFCKRNWWKNILYINNLPVYDSINDLTNNSCHGMSWYLGVDMQLFILSPLLLFPVWKWRLNGTIPLGVVTIASIIVPAVITYVKKFPPTNLPFQKIGTNFSQLGFTPTYMRATPYLIGMCTGVVYLQFKRKLNRTFVMGAWLLALTLGITALFGPRKFYQADYHIEPLESAFYSTGHRAAWSVAISWMIFACATGNGGWINKILSWSPFVPLGRLTFTIYLVSMHVQFFFHLQYRQPIYFSNYHMVNLFFAHFVMSCIVAVICTLTIEAPLMQLIKLVLPTGTKYSKDNNGTDIPRTSNSINRHDSQVVLAC